MEIFSTPVDLPAGLSLGGFSSPRHSSSASNSLEVNGWSFTDKISGRKVGVYAIDALYPGELSAALTERDRFTILAASHTHYAPMLDGRKRGLGEFSSEALDAYNRAILVAPRRCVAPNICEIYRGNVSIPVYRRFDYPPSMLNRYLTRHGGLYPNEALTIDKSVYLFIFRTDEIVSFAAVYHACHPVSRIDPMVCSPDYVGAIRQAVRRRFNTETCMFFLGCAGDIRPNFARKRVDWLPRGKLNWRFEKGATIAQQTYTDESYAATVTHASLWKTVMLDSAAIRMEDRSLSLRGQEPIVFPRINLSDSLYFDFLPFEVSHLYNLRAKKRNPLHFIVSCCNRTRGYLPDPQQIIAGGYEVDSSRFYMELDDRVELESKDLW